MKNYISLVFLLTLFVFGCTPKVAETTKKAGEKVEEILSTETFRNAVPRAGPAPEIQIGSYDQFELANGLKVVVVENHKLPRVSYKLLIDAPEIAQKDFAGYIDIAGDLMSKGTKTKTKAQIDEEVDYMGGQLTTTGTGVSGASLTKHSEKLLAIMSDVLLNPSFPKDEFEKIKKQTLSGLETAKSDPSAIATNVASVLRYGKDHPYGEIVTEETVSKITLGKCQEYYKTYFKPNISYLAIVGDITMAEAKPMVEKYFGNWKKGDKIPSPKFPRPMKPESSSIDFVHKDGAVQSVINITYPIDLQPGHPDVIKTRVMNTMLGGFFQSNLNQNLREKNAYTYGARSRVVNDKNVGYFLASASVRNEVTDSSVTEFLKELNLIRDQPLSASNLDMVKNVVTGNFARSLAKPATIARFALNTARYNLPADYYANYLKKVSQVSAADVQAMAQKYVLPDNAHILVVGNKEEVADKLAPLASSGKVNFYDNYGNPIEDAEVPSDMTADIVLADYINAIGGVKKLAGVKRVMRAMSMDMQGASISMEMYQEDPNKYAMSMKMNGQVMQKQVFDGTRGKVMGMGGNKELEGPELEEMKSSAVIFPELNYASMGYKSNLLGVETIDGVKAYKIGVEKPNGSKATEYYDMATSLKIRRVEATGETIDYQDYQAVEGIMFPFNTKISGGQTPIPMQMKTSKIEVNKDFDASVFSME